MWECENVSGNMNLREIFGKTPKNIPKCWLWCRLAELHISPSAAFESWLEAGKGEWRQLQTFHDAVLNFPSTAEFSSLLSSQQLMSSPHLTFSSRPAYAKTEASPQLTLSNLSRRYLNIQAFVSSDSAGREWENSTDPDPQIHRDPFRESLCIFIFGIILVG